MILIPSIDIYKGRVVRLTRGNFSQVKVYSANPQETALYLQTIGCKILHIVDLEGALSGQSAIFPLLKSIISKINIKIQFGGGIRTMETAEKLFNIGVYRLVMGSSLINNPGFFTRLSGKYPDRTVVSVDFSENSILTDGWTKKTPGHIEQTLKKILSLKPPLLVITDINKDGTLTSPDFKGLKKIIGNIKIPFILSGGFTSENDLETARLLGAKGVILGKAVYEKKLNLENLLKKYYE